MILDENLFEDVDNKELLKSQQSEKMSDVEDKAKEVQTPVYADAVRQMKKTAKIKADTTKVEKEPKHEEKPKKPKMADGAKKLKLNEDFYYDEDDEDNEEGICPACGGLITYDGIDDEHLVIEDTETAYYNCKCKNCGTRYREYHEIQLNFSHYEKVQESSKDKISVEGKREPLDETLNEYSKLNWRGVEGVKLIDHGAYSDPELFYKDEDGTKYYANYWDVEDSMWEYFLEEVGHEDAESGKPEVEAAFDKFCQEHRDAVISDIMDMAKPIEESLNENTEHSVGAQIAEIIASAIGTHGAYGEETVEAVNNTVELISQVGVEQYRFNDDGSVDFINVDEAVDNWQLDDPSITDEDADRLKEDLAHFDSVLDLLDGAGTTWFMYLDDSVEEEIRNILNKPMTKPMAEAVSNVDNVPDFYKYCIVSISSEEGEDWDYHDWNNLVDADTKAEAIETFNKHLQYCRVGDSTELHGIDYEDWYEADEHDDVYPIVAVTRVSENEYKIDYRNAYEHDCDFDVVDGKLIVL